MKTQIIESVTIAQAYQTILQSIKIYFQKDNQGRYRMERRRARPICLMGPAGIGKTEIVRQAAEENDLAFLSYSITHHTRQSIIGLPRLIEGEANGKTCSMTEYTMSEIIAQIHKTMQESGKQEGILFLDEFNCASESLRPIMLQLLQDKSFGPHPIPDGWMLVLAGNPSEYNRSAADLDAVTADRMRLLHIQPDYKAWRSYILQHHAHPAVLSYLDHHKDHFYVCQKTDTGTALATARGWEDLSLMTTYLEDAGEQLDLALVAQFIQASEAARGFYQHYQQYHSILASPIPEQIMEKSPKAVTALQKMRTDRTWCLASALLQSYRKEAQKVLENPHADAWKNLYHHVSNMVLVCRNGLDGKGSLDYLLHDLCYSKISAEIMEHCPSKEFQQMFQQVSQKLTQKPDNFLQHMNP